MTNIPEELQERIAAYIDGELSPADAARLEVFLANTDPKLADEVIGMIADRHQVKLLARPAAPLTAFLVGLAAGRSGTSPREVAAKVSELAASWDADAKS